MKTQLTKNRSCVLILEARPRLLVNREGRLFVTADTFTAISFRCSSGIIFTAVIESIVIFVTFHRRNRKRILRFFPDD